MLSIHVLSQLNNGDFEKWHILSGVALCGHGTQTHRTLCDAELCLLHAGLTWLWDGFGAGAMDDDAALSRTRFLWQKRIKILCHDS